MFLSISFLFYQIVHDAHWKNNYPKTVLGSLRRWLEVVPLSGSHRLPSIQCRIKLEKMELLIDLWVKKNMELDNHKKKLLKTYDMTSFHFSMSMGIVSLFQKFIAELQNFFLYVLQAFCHRKSPKFMFQRIVFSRVVRKTL